MPRIQSTAVALPPYQVTQQAAEDFARRHFTGLNREIDRLTSIFPNAGIATRYFTRPLDWLALPHTLAEKNNVYIESATALCAEAITRLLRENDLTTSDIDYLIYVNTTGLATPSIDARLINQLRFRPDIRRCPIWGLGCAGGVAGLSHAYHHAIGHPGERVLLVAAELCGLTFLPEDGSRSNIVATALFGEGAAAVLITGDGVASNGPRILGTQSHFYPDSLDVMGWNVVAQGLQVVFAQRIPDIVSTHAAEDLGGFLGRHGLALSDVAAFLFHPGGKKVLAAYEKALGFGNGELELSRAVLRDYGNMSSVTVLFVLDRYLRTDASRDGHIVLSALGPGFCSESVLARW
jgi:alkylresorcinol/alkylpyrone synthase